ncbi:MAG: Fpg/Nei family DNA glycosylase [Planctomycetota bacterium]
MPELPDVVVYLEHIERVALGHRLDALELHTPFILRSVDPPAAEFAGKKLVATRRIGKRLVLEFEAGPDRSDPLFAVIHLMVAGRLHWYPPSRKADRTRSQFSFRFGNGQLRLTEAGTKRRASLHLVRGEQLLSTFDPGGIEVLGPTGKPACKLKEFAERLRAENHTLKRTLTDPTVFSGIGGAYADEIMHRAKVSPVALTQKLDDAEVKRLHVASAAVLHEWVVRLRAEYDGKFPEGVTAFRPEMNVHGKFGQPCPVCGTPVQRIVYAERETNYCPVCQTDGKLLADRALSRLLRSDWPKTLEELENLKRKEP